jgi:hypothetical protein
VVRLVELLDEAKERCTATLRERWTAEGTEVGAGAGAWDRDRGLWVSAVCYPLVQPMSAAPDAWKP